MNSLVFTVIKYVILGIAVLAIIIAHKKWNFNDNNMIETIVEKEVKDQTGLTVDLNEPEDPSNPSK